LQNGTAQVTALAIAYSKKHPELANLGFR